MNTLSYTLLGLIARQPLSGYDLLRQMRERMGLLWPVRHSQIYPELAQMEAQGLITHQVVEQQDRPAKKVYSLTLAGNLALEQWVTAPTPPTSIRDEFILKAYSVWVADPQEASARFREQEAQHQERLANHEQTLARLQEQWGDALERVHSPLFGSAIALHYGISYEQMYLAWLRGVIAALENAHLGQKKQKP
jgi:DNA-binding PadR family transcriptional regulator